MRSANACEIGRLADAVAQLGLSTTLRDRLQTAEAEMADLAQREWSWAPDPEEIVERYRANLMRLTQALQSDTARARVALAGILGTIRVDRRADGVYATLEMQPAAFLLAAGVQMGLVAGEGFEPSTFGL